MRHATLRVIYNPVPMSPPLRCSEDCYDFFISVWDKRLINIQEQVYVLYLNGHNQVITCQCVNTGNADQTLFDTKFTLACGLGCLAAKLVIAHNHPSGILKPSKPDILMTARLIDACELVGMKLEEHLIICADRYYSFVDNGII